MWVDAERWHCPDGGHGATLVVLDRRCGGVVLQHVLVLLVVPGTEGVGDFLQLVLVVRHVSEEVDVVTSLVGREHTIVEVKFDTLVLCFVQFCT